MLIPFSLPTLAQKREDYATDLEQFHDLNRQMDEHKGALENKVKERVAECISAANYPMDADKLSLKNKLNRLLNQAALNTNVSRNSVHVSLNFDTSENHHHSGLTRMDGLDRARND